MIGVKKGVKERERERERGGGERRKREGIREIGFSR